MKLFSLFLCSAFLGISYGKIACPAGFASVNSKCLKIFPNHLKHLEAETGCRQYGGTLVTVKNAIDNRAIINFAANAGASYIWLGIYCFDDHVSSCYHDDGSGALSYSNFASGFPNTDSIYGGCVYTTTIPKDINVGRWFSGPCEVAGFAFVCEVPTTVADPSCTHNYNGYCYLPSHEIPNITATATFTQAQEICQSLSSNLSSVHSQQENDYIKSLHKNSGFNSTYLGGESFSSLGAEWLDGTNLDYNYTDPIGFSNGTCLVMDISNRVNNGMWSGIDCQTPNHFVCKRKIRDTTANVKTKSLELNEKVLVATSTPDLSHCNSTLYLAPGVVTSFGYPSPNVPATYCIWKLAVLGPYHAGLYFTDFSVSEDMYIYDGNGNLIAFPGGNKDPFEVLAPTNMVTIDDSSKYDSVGDYHGFSVTVLPY